VGVRWLLPGPDGTDVPRTDTIAVDDKPVRQAPAFFSRLMSGWHGKSQTTWARRNRMHGRVSFHHNLRVLFPWVRALRGGRGRAAARQVSARSEEFG
jgi:hypothetical protein